MNQVLSDINSSSRWGGSTVSDHYQDGTIFILVGTMATGKSTFARNNRASEHDYNGDIGDLAVHLVGRLLNNQVNGEETPQYAVSMHNEYDDAVALVQSIGEHFNRPVKLVEFREL